MAHRVAIFFTTFGKIITTVTQDPVSMAGKQIYVIKDPITFEDDPMGPYEPLEDFLFKDGYQDMLLMQAHITGFEMVPTEEIVKNYHHAVAELRSMMASGSEIEDLEDLHPDFEEAPTLN